MLAQDLCIHTLQLSHATALCDQLTVSWHTPQGNIAFSVGPGLRAMSPESAKMSYTAKDDGALSGRPSLCSRYMLVRKQVFVHRWPRYVLSCTREVLTATASCLEENISWLVDNFKMALNNNNSVR